MTEAYSGREGPESFFPQGNGKNATELRAIPSNFLALCFNFLKKSIKTLWHAINIAINYYAIPFNNKIFNFNFGSGTQ